ncbi:MAG: patatin-like phospholipase domain-containing protein [Proteobacteria bacterium]|nr:patatin-like phospholipase domain-containing protein [Pseudomonadota bacterium]
MNHSPSRTRTAVLFSTKLFADLDEATVESIAREFDEMEIAAGENLVRQGDPGDSLFVVQAGRLRVVLEGEREQIVNQLGPGDLVGEMALILGGDRSATVQALERTRVLRLSRQRFDRLVETHPELMATLSQALHKRMRRLRMAGYLRSLFGELDIEALTEIEDSMTWVHVAGGEELFRQGDAADGAYIVAGGRLRVVVADAGSNRGGDDSDDSRASRGSGSGERTLDEIGPGQWIGEMALLTRKERSATVYAVRDSELLWLSQSVFDDLIVKYPRAMIETSRLLVHRLQRQTSSERSVSAEARSFAIVPASPDIAINAFCEQLVRALSRHDSVVHLTPQRVDQELGKRGISRISGDDPANLRLVPWLIEQENNHRYVVYQADSHWSPWSDRAIRHADHILIVADDRYSPAIGESEARMASRFATVRAPRRSLVLLHAPAKTAFPGTARWLKIRHVDAHYHIRRGSASDMDRLARFLTGHAICLVLGGGGSRGYAHVGVIRGFEELGIPIDAIAGTSIGAVVAGAHALGMKWAELLGVLRPVFDSLIDPTLPIVSLASGRRAVLGGDQVAGSLHIEDLAIPYFCISTNLTRGQEVVHRRGSLATATRASGSLPGIFPPVPWNGDLLVDGGLSNNVPVDTMVRLFHGAVVAIDVMPEVDLVAGRELPMHLSGWKVAWRMVNPLSQRVDMPNIVTILTRAVTTASHSLRRAEMARQLAALYLKPPVKQWNLLNFKAAPSIAEQGYRGTIETLRAWWQQAGKHLIGNRAGDHGSTEQSVGPHGSRAV